MFSRVRESYFNCKKLRIKFQSGGFYITRRRLGEVAFIILLGVEEELGKITILSYSIIR